MCDYFAIIGRSLLINLGGAVELPRLKEWRLRRALAQRDLSAVSGVGVSTINRIERGLQLARPSTARRLAEALNVRPDDLMSEAATVQVRSN